MTEKELTSTDINRFCNILNKCEDCKRFKTALRNMRLSREIFEYVRYAKTQVSEIIHKAYVDHVIETHVLGETVGVKN